MYLLVDVPVLIKNLIMDRREFLKAMALAGAAAVVDFGSVGKALAQTKGANGSVDLVAIMGGTPTQMLNRVLTEFGGIGRFVKKGMKVTIKPNIGWDRKPEMAANTNPQLVGELVRQCKAAGAAEVLVFDHTCNEWTRCYSNSGIRAAVEAAGGTMVPSADESYYREVSLPRGVKLKKAKIHQAILDCDVWFNVPILKHHGGAKMTMSMKNYMGIVWDRQAFHSLDLQQCIADINTYEKRPALHIVDCYRAMFQNGPQGKSTDDVIALNSLIASVDPVAADTAALSLFTQAKPMDKSTVTHIAKAEALHVGTTKLDTLNIKRIKL